MSCCFSNTSKSKFELFLKYFWNNDENAIRKNIKIHFLPRNDKGYIMKSDNGESPDVGYIRPLMIVEIDNRYD